MRTTMLSGLHEIAYLSISLLVTDSFDWIELGGLNRRINSEQKSDADGNAKGDDDGCRCNVGRPARRSGDDVSQRIAKRNSDEASDDRDQDGLRQELTNDVGLACTNGAANTDFPGAFKNGSQHDVHDTDAAHQQRDARNTNHDHAEDELRAALLLEQTRWYGDVKIAGVFVRGRQNGIDD